MRNSDFVKKEIDKIEGLIKEYDDDLDEISGKINSIIEAHSHERKKIILEEELKRKDLDRKEKEEINDDIKHIDLLISLLKPLETLEELENIQRQKKMQRLRYVNQKNGLKEKIADAEIKSNKKGSKSNQHIFTIPYNVYEEIANIEL